MSWHEQGSVLPRTLHVPLPSQPWQLQAFLPNRNLSQQAPQQTDALLQKLNLLCLQILASRFFSKKQGWLPPWWDGRNPPLHQAGAHPCGVWQGSYLPCAPSLVVALRRAERHCRGPSHALQGCSCTFVEQRIPCRASSSQMLQTGARFILHLLLFHIQDCRKTFLAALLLWHSNTEVSQLSAGSMHIRTCQGIWTVLGMEGSWEGGSWHTWRPLGCFSLCQVQQHTDTSTLLATLPMARGLELDDL